MHLRRQEQGRWICGLLRCLWLIAASHVARAQSAGEPSCRADYRIHARVDLDAKTITGDETIVWTNRSRDDVRDLWFHLYWNAFANNRSTHLLQTGGELRGVPVSDEWGWIRIVELEAHDKDLTAEVRYRQPDDGNVEDKTVVSVNLPRIVRPGDSVTVRVKWEAKIPRVRRRTGHKDDFLFIAQWFPKLGVYETGNGWNCHQFHASTEFFADYGTYDVTLDLPAQYEGKVGASGVRAEPSRVADGRVIERYVAPSEKDRERRDATGRLPLVHDFAWTADPDYVIHRATFHYDEWAERFAGEVERTAHALQRDPGTLRTRDVDITVLLQPEHADQGERHYDATCTALFFYGLWFGEYPFEHVTVVDPAWGAGGASGMEYPTIFTAGTRMFTRPSMQSPERVTVHECGHQFWQGVVGNNEFEASWLDEGFNTFTQNEAVARRYGLRMRTTDFAGYPVDGVALAREPGGGRIADALALRSISLPFDTTLVPLKSSGALDAWRLQPWLSFGRMRDDLRWLDRDGYLADPDSDPVDTPAWQYVDRRSYRQNSYARPAVLLRTLSGVVGYDMFLRGMRRYAETWRYAHPYPQDFFDEFNAGADANLRWFFDDAFRSTATVDWQITVDQSRAKDAAGWFLDSSGVFQKRDAEAKNESRAAGPENGTAAPTPVEDAPKAEKLWKVDVVVRRKGTLILPLKIELTYDDASTETLIWSREDQARATWWKPLSTRAPSPRKLVSAVIDPDRVYYVDADMSDNQWFEAVDDRSPWRWTERVFTQTSHVLHWYGGLGG
ncbi:MAG: M1 family metallopeptidase [Planctomycetota bacterium]